MNLVLKRPKYTDIDPRVIYSPEDLRSALNETGLGPTFWLETKFDGLWGQAVSDEEGHVRVYSRTGKLKKQYEVLGRRIPEGVILHGELMQGTQRSIRQGLHGQFYAFDAVGPGFDSEPPHRRREAVEDLVRHLGHPFYTVPQLSADHYMLKQWWGSEILPHDHEGVVLKPRDYQFGDPWVRIKRTYEIDYICMGVNYSEAPKYKGRMIKSIIAGLYIDGELRRVCNVSGMSEDVRLEMYADPGRFVGKVFKATGKGIFPSGALRFPSFLEWHPDKLSSDCVFSSRSRVAKR